MTENDSTGYGDEGSASSTESKPNWRRDLENRLKEAEARGAEIILIATKSAAKRVDFAAHKIVVEDCDPMISPAVLAIPAQILAYLTAVEKGTDVDQPRNLAKSVTVE